MPIIFRRTVGELKFVSFLLFISIFVYIVSLFVYLGIKGTSLNPDKDYSQYWGFHFTRNSVTGVTIFLWSYSF